MGRLVYRTLLHELGRTLLSTLVVAAAIALILVFEGFRVHLDAQVRAFPDSLPADLVAMHSGVQFVDHVRYGEGAMPPFPLLSDADATAIHDWVFSSFCPLAP